MIDLILPEPPSANRYWRVFRGRAVTSAEARAYKRRVALTSRCRPLDGPVAVTVRWFRGRKAGDLDNRLKCLLDALKGVAFADDRQVAEIHAYRYEDRVTPRVEVRVGKAEG